MEATTGRRPRLPALAGALALVASFGVVPSASADVVCVFNAGQLTVTGDGASNTVEIAVNGSNQVTVNGATVDDGGSPATATEVTSISVSLGAGVDRFDLQAQMLTNLNQLTVNTGTGNDTIMVQNTGSANLALNGGGGNDAITVHNVDNNQANGGTGVNTFKLLGGADDDDVVLENNFIAEGSNGSTLTDFRNVVFNGLGGADSVNIFQQSNNRIFTFNGGGGMDAAFLASGTGRADLVRGRVNVRGGSARNFLALDFFNSPQRLLMDLRTLRNGDLQLINGVDLRARDFHFLDIFGSQQPDMVTVFERFSMPPAPPSPLALGLPPTPLRVFGSSGNDNLNLKGMASPTTVQAGVGRDRAIGGIKRDFLVGDAGNDTLKGGRGPDDLNGGDNTDKCFGGRGSDTFTSCETREQ
jgi:Ca2+-binding RTX toxin-like protein